MSMALWERDIQPFQDQLASLSSPESLRLAVEAIDWTLRTLPEPIEDPEVKESVDAVMRAARTAVEQRADRVLLPEDLIDRLNEVEEDTYEPGAAQLLSGLRRIWAYPGPVALEDVLYDCFAFCEQREDDEPDTTEEEEANTRCREVIAYQKELITQATA
jgi:hypothetical protein